MSNGFFYIVGQGVGYITSSWAVSLAINLLVVVAALLTGNETVFSVLSIFLGWASIVLIPEWLLGISSIVFSKKASTQLLILVYTIEVSTYVLISLLIFVDDSNPFLWLFLAVAHLAYIVGMETINQYSNRISHTQLTHLTWQYYIVFAVVTVGTDLLMGVVVAISDRPITIWTVTISAFVTLIISALVLLNHRQTIETVPLPQ